MRRVTIQGDLKYFGSKSQQVLRTDPEEETEDDETPVIVLRKAADDSEGTKAPSEVPAPPIVQAAPPPMRQSPPPIRVKEAPAPIVREAAELVRSKTDIQGRDILVRYNGEFVGVYRTPRKITNRTAYRTLAAVLQGEVPDFDPEKLELFRPVPLQKPPSHEILRGSSVGLYTRFDGQHSTDPVG